MTPIQVTGIEIDQFMFDVEITHLVDQDPDPTCRDSADDFSGRREIEWNLIYAAEYDDNGKCIACGELPWWLSKLTRDYAEQIEAKLWQWVEKQKRRQPAQEEAA